MGGEIGRRIDVTINNNMLVLNTEQFLAPFRVKRDTCVYIGLGKLINAAVEFAAYSKNEKSMTLKKHLVDEIIKAQLPDGYIGVMAEPVRMWSWWDIHEMGYIIYGLTSDCHYFGEKRSLEAACKAADYLLKHWSEMPAGWPQSTGVALDLTVIGLDRTMLTLYRETGHRRYLDFCLKQLKLPEWNLGIVFGRRYLVEGHVYSYCANVWRSLSCIVSSPATNCCGRLVVRSIFLRRETACRSPAAPASGKYGPTTRTDAGP